MHTVNDAKKKFASPKISEKNSVVSHNSKRYLLTLIFNTTTVTKSKSF